MSRNLVPTLVQEELADIERRAGHKTADSLQDLKKAAWYLNREIERMKHK